MDYNSDTILILDGIEAIRKRPGMYIGDTGSKGLHQLFFEVLENSIDEVMEGYCKNIEIILKDDSITVKDDGRGIPVDIKKEFGKSALELVFTKLHSGGKFNSNIYKVTGGLHGVGLSCVNALSEWLVVRVKKNNKIYEMRFEAGHPVTPLQIFDLQDTQFVTGETGTEISFKPDPLILEDTTFDSDYIVKRLRSLAFLNNNVKILFIDKVNNKRFEFYYEHGLKDYIDYLNENKTPIHPPILISNKNGDVGVDIVIQYTDTYSESIYSFANNIFTSEGGTHVTGFRSGLTKAINDYFKTKQADNNFSGDDVREGITAILNIKLPNPVFEGQTKNKLMNTNIKSIIESATYSGLEKFLEENPKVAEKILLKIDNARKAREAAQRSRDITRKKSSFGSVLPGKLADCSGRGIDREYRELFIVEGDSAGGSAKQARDKNFQAILPLKGKIINVEKSRIDKILKNDEIQALISAIGCGIGNDLDLDRLRYGKIIITTDADVDGAHIRTLLLTFFFRYMTPLIKEGRIYSAMPPLYKITNGKKEYYAYTDDTFKQIVKEIGDKDLKIQRYKGLGEMNPEQLWQTTINPESRTLMKINMDDAEEADKIFTMLMGEKVEPRREFIQMNADKVNLDV
ncbi:MAG: type IIA DNA topoisomerase subunit B [Candidatus Methanoliparum thermophilum]|uniref:DNA topoisomerase (ATP-hydrolyzing) n=1 Tax=Methanoliparum thermophilum TaxID=2491083 RepID=A0A520KRP5_METT2|nr:DNA topoisomerase subunit B [Candidatus Methanoliparum sp. LAM-1]RZN64435.1 MAG: type IIA DNA topoisomerase subunit B [Candidatus Methanoliparum thermophilum]BDC35978.1 DNA gyrase subunit B [Candidatus Methanoliparum sp. LAM-1]